uniref:Putative secreted protein n=1 Tax=Anopheles darlingi TaxID=43151 RepID=A0A2M4D2J6_ANODA
MLCVLSFAPFPALKRAGLGSLCLLLVALASSCSRALCRMAEVREEAAHAEQEAEENGFHRVFVLNYINT